MSISGLVLTLTEDTEAVDAALRTMALDPMIEVGEIIGPRLPVVVDAPDRATDRAVFERLRELPGVVCVDVAYVWFEDPEADAASKQADAA